MMHRRLTGVAANPHWVPLPKSQARLFQGRNEVSA